jgi:hypothetical protein
MRAEAQATSDRRANRRNDRKKTALSVTTVGNLSLDTLETVSGGGGGRRGGGGGGGGR